MPKNDALGPSAPPDRSPDLCDVPCFEAEVVRRVRLTRPDEPALEATRKVFSLLADRNRLLIVHALREAGELCVCDLAHVLGVSVSATSHHLRRLFDLGLLQARRDGKLVHYSLSHPWPAALVEQVLPEAVSL